ncbi:T9SS type A sorting domain-containing protein [Aequorivita ciconiae]|uniref:T9SS type A sorting domain-containing protein n=1 Tax=Aequorivita ciconiae TaxID=2494375 RepID=UPI0013E3157C|nr:T9SS type A sorting domain-containing protein [Aequorivita sp. H23M31]
MFLTVYSEDCSLGVSSFEDRGFYIQPNPVGEKLGLVSKTLSGKTTFKIFNSEGGLLSIQDLLFEEQASLDVSNLSSGIYILHLTDEYGNRATKKFVKK